MKFKLYFCSLRLKPWRATKASEKREARNRSVVCNAPECCNKGQRGLENPGESRQRTGKAVARNIKSGKAIERRATAKNRESRSEEHKEAAKPWRASGEPRKVTVERRQCHGKASHGKTGKFRKAAESRGKPWETTERSRRAYGKGHEE